MPAAVLPKKCKYCGCDLEPPLRTTCPSCKAERAREYHREWERKNPELQRRREANPRRERRTPKGTCLDCGGLLVGTEIKRSYCNKCMRVRNKAYRSTEAAKQKEQEWRDANREKLRERSREWAKANPRPRRSTPEKDRASSIRRKYGLSPEDFQAKLQSQGGLCAICGNTLILPPDKGSRLVVVDHDHQTGAVRGLLCRLCNVGIGSLGDDITVIEAAVAYLRKYTTHTGE